MTTPLAQPTFTVLDIAPEPYSTTPRLAARIGITASTVTTNRIGTNAPSPVHTVAPKRRSSVRADRSLLPGIVFIVKPGQHIVPEPMGTVVPAGAQQFPAHWSPGQQLPT